MFRFLLVLASSSLRHDNPMIANSLLRARTENEQQQKEKEKIDEELQQSSEGSSPEPNSNEVIIPILKKNGPILQSQ